MNNNMRFDGYSYPDMNLVNDIFMQNGMMNNNLNNMTNNQMNNMNSNMDIEMTTNKDLARPYEGFIRGNMYDNLYQQYKNYKPAKLVPNNEQAELLLNVNQLSFAAHEIRLYLDVFPNDRNMIGLFNQYQSQANEAIKAYEEKYGPIMCSSLSNTNSFSWETYSWPWEMEEM